MSRLFEITTFQGTAILMCVILGASILCVVFICSYPHLTPRFCRSLFVTSRDVFSCYKYHPQVGDDAEHELVSFENEPVTVSDYDYDGPDFVVTIT